jgi:hypothetical protein
MSDLTNCIQVFVIEPRRGLADVIQRALARIIAWYPDSRVPIMIYPEAVAADIGLPAEKHYTGWVLNLEHTDRYFDFVSRLIHVADRRRPKPAASDDPADEARRRG